MRNDITPDDLKKMKLVNIEAVDAESLVDIRDVKINPDLSKEERIAQFLNQIGKASDKAWIKYFKQYGNVRKLDRVLLVMLIDRIEVYGNSSFRVVFRYQDQYDIAKKENQGY